MAKRSSKEFTAFTFLVDKLLAVPRAALQKRIEQHREQAAKNPNKRGPKPKTLSDASASGHAATVSTPAGARR